MNAAVGLALLLIAGIIGLGVIALAAAARRRKKKAEEEPLRDTRLSFLAAMSFLCGLGATLLLVAASIVSLVVTYGDVAGWDGFDRRPVRLAAQIVFYLSLVPAAGALAFALGARGAIRESREELRGKSLYRSGVLLALMTGVFTLMGFKALAEPEDAGGASRATVEEETPRGYLGVEVDPGETAGAVRVKAVEEGSPAAAAGLKAGDVIRAARARTRRDGVTLFPGAVWNGTKESFQAWIEGLRPGDGVVMEVPAPDGTGLREAVLGTHPVSTLTALLREQGFDGERLAVLKPAAARLKFRVDEIVRICAAFDFDDGKLGAIRACLPGLVDPRNAFQLMGSLESQPAKDDLGRLLEKLPPPQR